MKITNGKVFLDGRFQDLEIKFENGVITEVAEHVEDDEVIDANGQDVYAGFVDCHVHGAFTRSFFENGHIDFSNGEEQIREILRRLPYYGVTSCAPTLMSEIDTTGRTMKEATQLIRKVRKDVVGADPFKIHYEGPFLNKARSGCINPDGAVMPSIEHAKVIVDNDFSDTLIICVAPELPGAMELISYLKEQGVHTEVCYTLASSDVVREAADHGLDQTSHMYNGFENLHHRVNGPILGVLLDNRIKAQMLCDGYHVAKDWIHLAIRSKGLENIYGITDMTCFSGLENGEHDFKYYGKIIVQDSKVYDSNGTIAGSNLTFDKMMRSARDNIGLTKEQIGSLYGENPALCLGIKDRGKIEVGRRADFTIMDNDYNVLQTIIKGETYYKA